MEPGSLRWYPGSAFVNWMCDFISSWIDFLAYQTQMKITLLPIIYAKFNAGYLGEDLIYVPKPPVGWLPKEVFGKQKQYAF